MSKSLVIVALVFILALYSKLCNWHHNSNKSKDYLKVLSNDCLVFFPKNKFKKLCLNDNLIYCGGTEGLVIINSNNNEPMQIPESIKSIKLISDLVFDNQNNLWIAHYMGLHVLKTNGELEDKTNFLPSRKVLSLFLDKNDTMWVGTYDGLVKFKDGKCIKFNDEDKLLHKNVNIIYIDSIGGKWFGSNVSPEGGISYFDGKNWHYYSVKNGLPHNNIVAIFEDKETNIWVGSGFHDRGGLSLFIKDEQIISSINGNSVYTYSFYKLHKNFYKEDGLAGEKCRSIYQDSFGIYWFGSEYNGFAIYDKKSWKVYDENHGFWGSEILDILEDKRNNIWLATNKGITFIPKKVADKLRNH